MARRRTRERSDAVLWMATLLGAFFLVDSFGGLELARRLSLSPAALIRALETLPTQPGSLEAWWAVATVWTSVLVHGDLMHLLYNVGYLWFFGTLLSQVVGERGVVVTVLLTTLTAGLTFALRNPDAAGVIGASGAVSGVSGFYCVLAFRWEDAPPAYAWPLAQPVPPAHAGIVAAIAIAMDLFVLQSGMSDGVAYDAHLGGFGGGAVLGALSTTFFPTWARFMGSRLGPRTR